MGRLAVLSVFVLSAIAGCGVVKKGGGGSKIVLSIANRGDSLNWDEQGGVHSVEVRVFVLKSPDQFMKGSVPELFELSQRKTFWSGFQEDIVAMEKITVNPGQPTVVAISYDKSKAASGQVYLGVVGNFNRPPDGNKERRYVKLKAGGGKASFYIPKNSIELPPKK